MSIWASVDLGGRDCRASDLSDNRTDNYAGTGADELDIGVATATSWNDKIRLSVIPDAYPQGLDADLLVSVESAEALRDMLDVAIKRIRVAKGEAA